MYQQCWILFRTLDDHDHLDRDCRAAARRPPASHRPLSLSHSHVVTVDIRLCQAESGWHDSHWQRIMITVTGHRAVAPWSNINA
jgi:hypothetical protein